MKTATKNKLIEAQAYCDENDKSTEFMLQYMQDFAGVDLDCVIGFLEKQATISDGFGSEWSLRCPECGKNSMQVVRPGKAQCKYCG